MKSMPMTIFIILGISVILIGVNQSVALQQVAGPLIIEVEPGKSNTVQWGLVSDKDDVTEIQISAEGEGAQLLSFQKTLSIEPGQLAFVDITVSVPDNYPADIELNPTIVATEFGETGGATVLNIQMKKTLTIKIISVESYVEQDQIPLPESTQEQSQCGPNQILVDGQCVDKVPVTPEESICGPGTVLVNGQCVAEKKISEEKVAEKGGCLIATATYGTELAPQVQLLREIRDNTVLSTHSGATFMSVFNSFYYSFSPTVADLERQSPLFKEMVRAAITPMISTLAIFQYVDIDSEAKMLGYGIGIILLNIGMYFVSPFVVIKKLRYNK